MIMVEVKNKCIEEVIMVVKNENKLVRFHTFQYNSLTSTEKYLEQMASNGWILEEISGGVKFIFKKSEPVKLHFSVNIFSEGSEFDTHLLETNLEYIEYCKSAGWTFACTSGKVHVFYSEDENTPVIDSDPMIKLKTIHKIMGPQKMLIGSIMSAMAMIQIVYSLTVGLNQTEQSSLVFSNLVLWIFVLVIWAIQMIGYSAWYAKAKYAVKSGNPLPDVKNADFRGFVIILATFSITYCGILCWAGIVLHEYINFVVIPICLSLFALLYVSNKIMQVSEKRMIGRTGLKFIVLLIGPIVFSCLMFVMIIGFVIVYSVKSEDQNVNMITNTSAFKYDGVELGEYEQRYSERGTFLIKSYYYVLQGRSADKSIKSWDFYVWETKIPAIHNRLIGEAIDGSMFRTMGIILNPTNTEIMIGFDTKDVNVYASQSEDDYEYLLYDEDSIVKLRSQTKLTKEQFDVIYKDIMN